jgi:hypothetical protein
MLNKLFPETNYDELQYDKEGLYSITNYKEAEKNLQELKNQLSEVVKKNAENEGRVIFVCDLIINATSLVQRLSGWTGGHFHYLPSDAIQR